MLNPNNRDLSITGHLRAAQNHIRMARRERHDVPLPSAMTAEQDQRLERLDSELSRSLEEWETNEAISRRLEAMD